MRPMSLAELFLEDYSTEAHYTRKVLYAIPDGHMDWKPHDRSMPLGHLVGHLAELPGWVDAILGPDLDFAAMDYEPFHPATAAEARARFEEGTHHLLSRLGAATDDTLLETWFIRMGDAVLSETSRYRALRETLLLHAAHHRGQLTVYLRLLDVPVPPTYGPTADDEHWVAAPDARP